MKASPKNNASDMLKALIVLGGSSSVNVVIGMVRAKINAILIGAAGLGLFSAFTSISGLFSSIGNLGVTQSGVRFIAIANGDANSGRLAVVYAVMRRMVLILATLTALALIVSCRIMSKMTFGNYEYAPEIALLGVAVFFGMQSGNQICTLQGLRQTKMQAKFNVLTGLNGIIIGIPCYYFWHLSGVIVFITLNAVVNWLYGYYFIRKLHLPKVRISLSGEKKLVRDILYLGIGFTGTVFLWQLTSYVTKLIQIHFLTLSGIGLIAAAMALTKIMASTVLQSLWGDYYPRLCAASGDRETRKVMNKETSVLLAAVMPIALSVMLFSPLFIRIFYTSKFIPATEITRWFCFSVIINTVNWPLCFILAARGMVIRGFVIDVFKGLLEIGLCWFGVARWGLRGIGYAAVAQAVIVSVMQYGVFYYCCRSVWDRYNWRMIAGALILGGALLAACDFYENNIAFYCFGTVFCIALSAMYGIMLMRLLKLDFHQLKSVFLKKLGRGQF